jgi:hypothetical protein
MYAFFEEPGILEPKITRSDPASDGEVERVARDRGDDQHRDQEMDVHHAARSQRAGDETAANRPVETA